MVRPALLLFADFPSGALRCWTGYGDLSWSGNTYAGVGDMIAVEAYEETTDTRSAGMSFTASGIDSSMLSDLIADDYQGRRCDVHLAMMDGAAVVDDPVLLFRGFLDSDNISEDGQTATVNVKAEHRIVDILKSRTYYYTPEDQNALHPSASDKGFDFIAALQSKELIWRPND